MGRKGISQKAPLQPPLDPSLAKRDLPGWFRQMVVHFLGKGWFTFLSTCPIPEQNQVLLAREQPGAMKHSSLIGVQAACLLPEGDFASGLKGKE